jgi:hypothetical protein
MATTTLTFSRRPNQIDMHFYLAGKAPGNNATVTGLYLLDRAPAEADVLARFAKMGVLIPRFRQHLGPRRAVLRRPLWIDDEDVDVARHVHWVELAGASTRALVAVTNELQRLVLAPYRAPWEAWIFTGLEGGCAALLWRTDHTVSDGVALSQATLECFGTAAAAPDTRILSAAKPSTRISSAPARPGARGRLATALSEYGAGISARHTSSCDRLTAYGSVPADRWIDKARALEGSVNDLFLAIAARTLRVSADAEARESFRLLMPVGTRTPGAPADGGNTSAMARVVVDGYELETDSISRLGKVTSRARADALSPALRRAERVAELAPSRLVYALNMRRLRRDDAAASHLVTTTPMCLGDAKISHIFMQLAPIGPPVAFGLNRYLGRCNVSVNVDIGVLPGGRRVCEAFLDVLREEFGTAGVDLFAPWTQSRSGTSSDAVP